MIDEKFARDQIKRLAGLSFFPQEPSAIRELIIALRCAETPEMAKQVIDSIVEGVTECPKPAEIRRAVYSTREKATEQYELPAETKCSECGDTGWRSVERNGYNFAEKCACGWTGRSETQQKVLESK